MHTEEQASELWCPMVRHDAANAWGGVRVPEVCRCIGSRCMMWRWEMDGYRDGGFISAFKRGFCGLAGEPAGPVANMEDGS